MQLNIDTQTATPAHLRAAAAMLLTLCGDITLDAVDSTAPTRRPAPQMPTPPKAPSDTPYPPPPPGSAPPPPAAAAAEAPPPPPPSAPPAAPEVPAAPLEYDTAGMPWDARIHQKGKARKKDGTWKVQKNIPVAFVQGVTAELAAKKLAANAPSTQVAAAMAANPTIAAPPPPGAPPVPPGVNPLFPNNPPGPGIAFRDFMQKVVALNKSRVMDAQQISAVVQKHGSPNLQSLAQMEHLIPAITADLDLYVATAAAA